MFEDEEGSGSSFDFPGIVEEANSQEKQVSPISLFPHLEKVYRRRLHKRAINDLCDERKDHSLERFNCCSTDFLTSVDIYKHVTKYHVDLIGLKMSQILKSDEVQAETTPQPTEIPNDWPICENCLPSLENSPKTNNNTEKETVLLFYKYFEVPNPKALHLWLENTCKGLDLLGKVRLGDEGINGTLSGEKVNTDAFMTIFLKHPYFEDKMTLLDFKTSDGPDNERAFDELRIRTMDEICPMGVSPDKLFYGDTSEHVKPEEFHNLIKEKDDSTVLLDCRNFYEWEIGHFEDAIRPNIRKFSYFPEYVDANPEIFKNKNVLMYCTGGIRCEKGSAYLKSTGLCKDVKQLEGGIHRYLEKYPQGFYRGKLFVFDKRVNLAFNDDVVSECRGCGAPYDKQSKCSTTHCHRLLIVCPSCVDNNVLLNTCIDENDEKNESFRADFCCPVCYERNELAKTNSKFARDDCRCTQNRTKIGLVL